MSYKNPRELINHKTYHDLTKSGQSDPVKTFTRTLMENAGLDKSLDNGSKDELEKHLPEWFILIRKLVAEHLHAHSSPKAVVEGNDENKTNEVKT